jgi:hypothetical protein
MTEKVNKINVLAVHFVRLDKSQKRKSVINIYVGLSR